MLEFQTRKLKVKIDEQVHELSFPNRKQIVPVLKSLKEAENDPAATLELASDLLVSLGLPQEVADSLEVDFIVKIFEAVQGKKK
jgi:adenylate kinase